MQCMLLFAEKNFLELKKKDRRVEIQIVLNYMILMTTRMPDHTMAIRIFEIQGILNLVFENFTGAVK